MQRQRCAPADIVGVCLACSETANAFGPHLDGGGPAPPFEREASGKTLPQRRDAADDTDDASDPGNPSSLNLVTFMDESGDNANAANGTGRLSPE